MDSTPLIGITECPASLIFFALNFSGARPDPFNATISSDPAGLSRIKQSPPMPAI